MLNVISGCLMLYLDAFELVNPLGSDTCKVFALYFRVLNIPSAYRSTIVNLQLAMLCKGEHAKVFGMNKFLSPMIGDLKKLQNEGLVVQM